MVSTPYWWFKLPPSAPSALHTEGAVLRCEMNGAGCVAACRLRVGKCVVGSGYCDEGGKRNDDSGRP